MPPKKANRETKVRKHSEKTVNKSNKKVNKLEEQKGTEIELASRDWYRIGRTPIENPENFRNEFLTFWSSFQTKIASKGLESDSRYSVDEARSHSEHSVIFDCF